MTHWSHPTSRAGGRRPTEPPRSSKQRPQKLKAEPPPKAPFDPAPALRPTIQDKIEIDRALIALRSL